MRSPNARKLGRMLDRVQRTLNDEPITRIAGTYHAWRGDDSHAPYANVPGFCKATLEEVRGHGHMLTPGRYVGAAAMEDGGELFAESARLGTAIRTSLAMLANRQEEP